MSLEDLQFIRLQECFNAQKNNSCRSEPLAIHQLAEVFVFRDKNSVFSICLGKKFIVGGGNGVFRCPRNIMTGYSQPVDN